MRSCGKMFVSLVNKGPVLSAASADGLALQIVGHLQTCTDMEMSFWQIFYHWLHQELSKWHTFCAAIDGNFIKMMTLLFQCMMDLVHIETLKWYSYKFIMFQRCHLNWYYISSLTHGKWSYSNFRMISWWRCFLHFVMVCYMNLQQLFCECSMTLKTCNKQLFANQPTMLHITSN